MEAKAHDEELNKEIAGRLLGPDASEDRIASHGKIGAAIEGMRLQLETASSSPWRISRDSHYQMSNRFAWAAKLTEFSIPVVLIYLGFLHADEMADRGKPFASQTEWAALVKSHSAALFPSHLWDTRLLSNGQPLIPLIRSIEQPLFVRDIH